MQKSKNKRLILLIAVVLTSFLFWVSVKPWVIMSSAGDGLQGENLIILAVLFLLAISVLGLAYYLFADYKYSLLAAGISGITYFLAFGIHPYYFIAIIAAFVSQFIAVDRIVGDIKARITVHPRSSIGRGITFIVTSFLILLVTGYYVSPAVQESAQTKELPLHMRQLIKDVSRKVLAREFEQLTPRERSAAEYQIEQQVNNLFNDFVGPYRQFMPFMLAVLLFLLLQSVGILATALASYLAAQLFKILRRLKFVHIEEQDVKAQRMVF